MENEPPPMHPAILADLLAEADKYGESDSLHMGSWEYAGLRKFGRDLLDMNVDVEMLKIGKMGSVFGKDIWVVPSKFCQVKDKTGRILAHTYLGGPIHHGPADACNDHNCVIRFVMTH